MEATWVDLHYFCVHDQLPCEDVGRLELEVVEAMFGLLAERKKV